MTDDQTLRVAELLGDERFAMLTTTAPDGTLTSRPMALQEVEPGSDLELWFFSSRTARKVDHVATEPRVNVTVSSASTWVSLTGTATVVQDDERKRELWNAGVEAWFPEGPDDDGIVLLRIAAESAEFWDTPGGRVASVLSFVKAKATGSRYEGGDNERVEL